MNSMLTKLTKNFTYSFAANTISIFISAIVLLILPKILSVTNYGYYQLYIFYSGYIGFFHLGWCDGLYLRYGGRRYTELDFSLFSFQFWSLFFFELFVSFFLIIALFIFVHDIDKIFILITAIILIGIVIPKLMLSYLLQATNRIKEYVIVTISEKIIFFLLIIVLSVFYINSYKLVLFTDIIAKTVSLCLSIVICRKIVTTKICSFFIGIREVWENLKVGSKLMIANIAGMLILGVIRFAIEKNWAIETFGKISLSISLSNMLMLFISSISVVLFPMLRRMKNDMIKNLYSLMKFALMFFLLGALLLYFPIYSIVFNWLPSYSDSLIYMSILLPVCIYESKMTILINTYLKTLRKEKDLLLINLFSLTLSVFLTYFNVCILHSLDLTVLSIVILFALRCIISEVLLSKYMEITVKKDICLEITLTIIFIIFSWNYGGMLAFVVYFFSYILYLGFKRKELKALLNYMIILSNRYK